MTSMLSLLAVAARRADRGMVQPVSDETPPAYARSHDSWRIHSGEPANLIEWVLYVRFVSCVSDEILQTR